MSESMREAVEGFERERDLCRMTRAEAVGIVRDLANSFHEAAISSYDINRAIDRLEYEGLEGYRDTGLFAQWARANFTRADVLDLATAANDARQSAILTPDIAESQEALADRLTNLAERLQSLVPKEGE